MKHPDCIGNIVMYQKHEEILSEKADNSNNKIIISQMHQPVKITNKVKI